MTTEISIMYGREKVNSRADEWFAYIFHSFHSFHSFQMTNFFFWKYVSSKLSYLTNWASTTNYIIHFGDIYIVLKSTWNCAYTGVAGQGLNRIKYQEYILIYRGLLICSDSFCGGGGGGDFTYITHVSSFYVRKWKVAFVILFCLFFAWD